MGNQSSLREPPAFISGDFPTPYMSVSHGIISVARFARQGIYTQKLLEEFTKISFREELNISQRRTKYLPEKNKVSPREELNISQRYTREGLNFSLRFSLCSPFSITIKSLIEYSLS